MCISEVDACTYYSCKSLLLFSITCNLVYHTKERRSDPNSHKSVSRLPSRRLHLLRCMFVRLVWMNLSTLYQFRVSSKALEVQSQFSSRNPFKPATWSLMRWLWRLLSLLGTSYVGQQLRARSGRHNWGAEEQSWGISREARTFTAAAEASNCALDPDEKNFLSWIADIQRWIAEVLTDYVPLSIVTDRHIRLSTVY